MAPRLRVLAGTSPSTMTPITTLVNTSQAHPISSPLFEGRIVTHIKGMTDEKGRVRESEYFAREDRVGVTWSIQVQGRFLVPYSADDILFGNTFDRPLKLPWGTSAVLKFMHYIDPTLEHDLTSSTKPWALSPLIATMPHFIHSRTNTRSPGIGHAKAKPVMPAFPTATSIKDYTGELYLALADPDVDADLLDAEGGGGSEVSSLSGARVSSSSSSSGSSSTRSSGFAPPHLAAPPVLIPGAVPPIPATSKHSTSKSVSVSGSGPGGSPNDKNAGQSLFRSGSFSTTRSSSSSGSGSSRSSLSIASSSSGSGNSSSKSTRSSGLNSIRMKTKDVVRKVKRKRSVSGMEMRMKKEEELKGLENAQQRRSYFAAKGRRGDVVFGPEDVVTTDFCYGFINFAPSLSLQLPGGLSFDLMKYWDGQPVRFVCCERPGAGSGGAADSQKEKNSEPWGRIFWCVAIEIVDDDEVDDEDSDDGNDEEEEEEE